MLVPISFWNLNFCNQVSVDNCNIKWEVQEEELREIGLFG
jgi:hypothetical protein